VSSRCWQLYSFMLTCLVWVVGTFGVDVFFVISGFCGASYRRGLRRTFSGMRSRPGIAADASGRPDLVLVISLALAGATARITIVGPTAQAGAAALISGGLAVLTLRLIENPSGATGPSGKSRRLSLRHLGANV
jgi:peptidoglycan/LPS O-acetylase OafA/YrhL